MLMSDKIKESDLSSVASQFLKDQGCHSVYGEALDIDLVGLKDKNFIIAIELKTALNIKVLEQAANRITMANYVYVGVPYDKVERWYRISPVYKLFIEHYGIGVIGIRPEETRRGDTTTFRYYKVIKHPKLHRITPHKHWLLPKLNDWTKDRDGGQTTENLETPYKWMLEQVKEYLKKEKTIWRNGVKSEGWLTIDNILLVCDRVKNHYANARGSLYRLLNASWSQSWVEKDPITKMYRYREQSND